jgi:hypothetical protein
VVDSGLVRFDFEAEPVGWEVVEALAAFFVYESVLSTEVATWLLVSLGMWRLFDMGCTQVLRIVYK